MCATHAKWQVGRLFRKLPGGLQSSGHKNIFVQIICALNCAGYFAVYLHTLWISKSWPRQKPGTPHNYAAIWGGCVLIFITDLDFGGSPRIESLASYWPHAIYKLKRKRRTLRIRNIAENCVIKIQRKSCENNEHKQEGDGQAWENSFQIKINAAAETTFMCPQRGRWFGGWGLGKLGSGWKSGSTFPPKQLHSQPAKMP